MTLEEIYNSGVSKWGDTPAVFTDKNSWHSYLPVYERLLQDRNPIKMLEIGVQTGGSLWLWQNYFRENNVNYEITGMDILPTFYCINHEFQNPVTEDKNITILWNTDSTIAPSYANLGEFNFIIDDGLHSYESQKASLEYGLPKLSKGGIFVIEDIVQPGFVEALKNYALSIDRDLQVEIHSGMKNNRFDDVMLILRK